MSNKTLNQRVGPNDLILVSGPKEACMLVVISAPDHQNPTTSSVIVRTVNWHIPALQGHWMLDGPNVYYAESGSEDNEQSCLCQEHSTDFLEARLNTVLARLGVQNETRRTRANEGFTITVNPYGRDVLKHYFKGWCPNCGTKGYFTPGSSAFNERFPEIPGSSVVDQACPVCMGYEFALTDKTWITQINVLLGRRYDTWRRQDANADTDAELDKISNEVMESVRERYGLIGRMRWEMGMAPEDFEKTLNYYKKLLTSYS